MRSSTILPLLLTVASALPQSLIPRELTERDIIVIRDGKISVMDKATYHAENAHLAPPPGANNTHNEIRSSTTRSPESATLSKRCDNTDVFTMNVPDQNFLNWDVAMSSVVKAGETTSTVSVTEGYSISNSVTASTSAGLTIVPNFLTATFGISTTQTWTSTYNAAYTFTVPAGKFGAVVSNPATIRKTGVVDSGCVGVDGSRATFTSDSYTSKAFGGLSWVEGTISLCTGDTYPLNMCIGDGTIS